MLPNPFQNPARTSSWLRYPNPFTMQELLELTTLFDGFGSDTWKLSQVNSMYINTLFRKLSPNGELGCKTCGGRNVQYGLNTNTYIKFNRFLKD